MDGRCPFDVPWHLHLSWTELRTEESAQIEKLLRPHFKRVDAYRFNPASIRIRVVDPVFRGLHRGQRVDLVEPLLDQLPPEINGEIFMLVLVCPDEQTEELQVFEHPEVERVS